MFGVQEKDIIEATQVAQDAQAGYACDYCVKRQPLAFNECKECVKGLKQLSERYRDNPLNKLGKRYAMRIMSDAYGKERRYHFCRVFPDLSNDVVFW